MNSNILLRARRKGHFKDLRHNRHQNRGLQNAFNKYGQNAFTFEVVLVCGRDAETLTMYEQRKEKYKWNE